MPMLGRVLGNVEGRLPTEPPPAPMFGRFPGCTDGRFPDPTLPPPTLGREPAPVLGRVLGSDGRLGVEGRAAGADGRDAGRLNDGELPTDGRPPPEKPPPGRLIPPPPPPPRKPPPPPPPPRPPRPNAKSVDPIATATSAANVVIQSRVFIVLPPGAIVSDSALPNSVQRGRHCGSVKFSSS